MEKLLFRLFGLPRPIDLLLEHSVRGVERQTLAISPDGIVILPFVVIQVTLCLQSLHGPHIYRFLLGLGLIRFRLPWLGLRCRGASSGCWAFGWSSCGRSTGSGSRCGGSWSGLLCRSLPSGSRRRGFRSG